MILHVDMDAFFASVEQLDNPALKGKCVIVGGISDRGVVSAASYEARKFGVHSAMPMYRARRLCPDGVFLSPRGGRYKALSNIIMDVLRSFSPLVEPVSIDEAYVDISGCESLFGGPAEIGSKIKARIKAAVGLNCSVGIAPLKFLAKIASDIDKPDGLHVITPEQVPAFIDRLPIGKVPGVGQVTGQALEKIGIRYLGDARRYTEKNLVARLGKYGHRLHELANGIDRSRVEAGRVIRSISSEETLATDTTNKADLRNLLLKHAEDVGRQMRRKGVRARTVFIKIKHSDFKQATRQAPLPRATQSAELIYRCGVDLLDAYRIEKPVRLAGLGVTDLVTPDTPVQMELFEEGISGSDEKWEKLGSTVDAIGEKFGRDAIRKAGLCRKEGGEE